MVSAPAGEVLRGYVPSDVFVGTGLYESCGILGGTLMPHAFYLGTALAGLGLIDFDAGHSLSPRPSPASSGKETPYKAVAAGHQGVPGLLRSRNWPALRSLPWLCLSTLLALLGISGSAFYNPFGGDEHTDDDGGDPRSRATCTTYTTCLPTRSRPAARRLFAVSLLVSGASASGYREHHGGPDRDGRGRWNIRLPPVLPPAHDPLRGHGAGAHHRRVARA